MVDASPTLLSQVSPTKAGPGSDTGSLHNDSSHTESNTSMASQKKTTIHQKLQQSSQN
jgi:hypothetical protein